MHSLLFHRQVFFPSGVDKVVNDLQRHLDGYQLSQHFEDHLKNQDIEDRSHRYLRDIIEECIKSLKTTQREAFEVELSKGYYDFGTSGWFVTKYCVRVPYRDNQDLVIVIRPRWDKNKQKYDTTRNMVVTAWLNNSRDAHFTLDKSKYSTSLH